MLLLLLLRFLCRVLRFKLTLIKQIVFYSFCFSLHWHRLSTSCFRVTIKTFDTTNFTDNKCYLLLRLLNVRERTRNIFLFSLIFLFWVYVCAMRVCVCVCVVYARVRTQGKRDREHECVCVVCIDNMENVNETTMQDCMRWVSVCVCVYEMRACQKTKFQQQQQQQLMRRTNTKRHWFNRCEPFFSLCLCVSVCNFIQLMIHTTHVRRSLRFHWLRALRESCFGMTMLRRKTVNFLWKRMTDNLQSYCMVNDLPETRQLTRFVGVWCSTSRMINDKNRELRLFIEEPLALKMINNLESAVLQVDTRLIWANPNISAIESYSRNCLC